MVRDPTGHFPQDALRHWALSTPSPHPRATYVRRVLSPFLLSSFPYLSACSLFQKNYSNPASPEAAYVSPPPWNHVLWAPSSRPPFSCVHQVFLHLSGVATRPRSGASTALPAPLPQRCSWNEDGSGPLSGVGLEGQSFAHKRGNDKRGLTLGEP